MVVVYKIDKTILNNLNVLFLEHPNDKWHEFVYNNRLDKAISEFHNRNLTYDVVYGCVADGIIGYLTRSKNHTQVEFEKFIELNKSFNNYDQLSFHTPLAVTSLVIEDINIIK